MGRIGVGRRAPQPYSPNLVILVVYGTMTWGLAREIVDTVTQNTLEPLEVSFPISNSVSCIKSAFGFIFLLVHLNSISSFESVDSAYCSIRDALVISLANRVYSQKLWTCCF